MAIVTTAVEANGWILAVTGTWPATAGAWEYGGADRSNGRFLAAGVDQFPLDPDGTPKILLTVEAPGHARAGGQAAPAAAQRRDIVATKAVRRPHGAATQIDERDNGDGTRTVRIALSDRVHSGATVVEARFLAGWKAGEPGAVLTTVSNGSARAAPLPIARWAVPSYRLVEGTVVSPVTSVEVDIIVASHHPRHHGSERNLAVAGVRVMATDGTSANYSWLSVRTSPLYGDNLRCWGGAVNLGGLNAGQITLHYEIYPWIGAARATGPMDITGHATTTLAGNGTMFETPLILFYDPVGARYGARRRYVCVDATSALAAVADQAAVTLHTSVEAAKGAPLNEKPANVAVALQAMRRFLDANPALNLPVANGVTQSLTRAGDFWEIILTDGQVHTLGPAMTGSGVTMSAREGLMLIRGDPASANPQATTILRSGTAASSLQCNRWLLRDLRLEMGQAAMQSGGGQVLRCENVSQTGKAGYEASTNGWFASGGDSRFLTRFTSFNYAGQLGGQFLRNGARTRGTAFTTAIGVRILREPAIDPTGANRTGTAFLSVVRGEADGMIWNCAAYGWRGTFVDMFTGQSGEFGDPRTIRRLAVVNSLNEGAVGEAAQQLGEGSYVEMQDSIFEGNTLVGSRFNWHNETPIPFRASGTTVTMGILGHGLAVGDSITVAGINATGSSTTAYNGTFAVSAVVDANRFSYVAASAPGTPDINDGLAAYGGATVRRNGDGAIFPIVRQSRAHIGNCIRNTIFDRNATKQDNWIGDSTQTGCHELLYGVCHEAVVRANRGVNSPADWQYAFAGLRSVTDLVYGYGTNPASYTDWLGVVRDGTLNGGGSASFDGDYRPQVSRSSRLIGKASVACIDVDGSGVARGTRFSIGAFEADAIVLAPETVGPESAIHGQMAGDAVLRLSVRAGLVPGDSTHAHTAGTPVLSAGGIAAFAGGAPRTLVVAHEDRGLAASRD